MKSINVNLKTIYSYHDEIQASKAKLNFLDKL